MGFSWTARPQGPLVIAHRGCSAVAPENTLASFALALEAGADGIELDVRFSADGKIVVIHDATLRRTTDGRGRISMLPYSAIAEHSASRGFGVRYGKERVPLLVEVLDLIDNRIGINIEIKEPPRSKRYDIVSECLRIVRRHHAERITMISSFHHPYVRRAKQLEPRVTTGVLQHGIRHLHRNPARIATSAGASWFLCSKSAVSKRLVSLAHGDGIHTGVYTVNHARSLPRILRAGVELIFTDDPVNIRAAINALK